MGVAVCLFAMFLFPVGCDDDDPSVSSIDGGNTRDASEADALPMQPDGGDLPDANGTDANGTDAMAGEEPDAGSPDAALDSPDAAPPEDSPGIADCATACETFLMQPCDTPAAAFCNDAQQNCEQRYLDTPACRAELEAMDACAASGLIIDFVCPLGTLDDPVRPYHTSEDVCVSQAIALGSCLSN